MDYDITQLEKNGKIIMPITVESAVVTEDGTKISDKLTDILSQLSTLTSKAITTDNIGSQSVNYAASAGSVAWGDVTGKPSVITSDNIGSQSVNYAASAGAVAWDNVSSKPSSYTPSSHTHTKSQITDFPSIPAAVAVKGNAESSYRTGNVNITPANIGLGNVNNTADANKSVKYATTAGSAPANGGTSAACSGNATGTLNTSGNIATNGYFRKRNNICTIQFNTQTKNSRGTAPSGYRPAVDTWIFGWVMNRSSSGWYPAAMKITTAGAYEINALTAWGVTSLYNVLTASPDFNLIFTGSYVL